MSQVGHGIGCLVGRSGWTLNQGNFKANIFAALQRFFPNGSKAAKTWGDVMVMHFKTTAIVADLDARPVTSQARKAGGVYARFLKRVIDVILVVAFAPVMLLLVGLAALLAMADGGSPFYVQKRVGQGGRVFNLLKIRTMVPDADRLLEAHLAADPQARAEWDRTQKLRRDPRITWFGCFLRKTSLDELPQLWNVLVGDMSLVGPRPMMVGQEALYPGTAYYALRPGITGPWQVTDRNESSFADRAIFDTDYHARLSFLTDLRLLLRTVGVVIRGTGC